MQAIDILLEKEYIERVDSQQNVFTSLSLPVFNADDILIDIPLFCLNAVSNNVWSHVI